MRRPGRIHVVALNLGGVQELEAMGLRPRIFDDLAEIDALVADAEGPCPGGSPVGLLERPLTCGACGRPWHGLSEEQLAHTMRHPWRPE